MSNYKSYFLKSLGLREDSLPGGKGDETKPKQVDPEQLAMGIKVEMEHTQDQNLAKEIAMDHLTENPQYYSHLKSAGLADELPDSPKTESHPPLMQNLLSPTARGVNSVIAVGILGTKNGTLPAGGYVADPEKARLGGWEEIKPLPQGGCVGVDKEKARLGGLQLVKNLKPNSQGAIANTPTSEKIKTDGGHFTPNNSEITKGNPPVTNVKGDNTIHPFQTQQLGNPPFEDDGTTRCGAKTPESAGGGGPGNTATKSEPQPNLDTPEPEDSPVVKGPWGIDMEDDEEETENEDGKLTVDIKETLDAATAATTQPMVLDWDSLVELLNGSEFRTPMGVMDFWGLAGFDGLSMKDMEEQTPKMFEFVLSHAKEALTRARQAGDKVSIPDIHTLKQQWQTSRKNDKKWQITQPRNCKVCGKNFTPKKGEGICPDCVTPSKNDSASDPQLKERFMKLANIKECETCGCGDPENKHGLEQLPDATTQLRELVGRLNSKGKVTPLLAKAEKYLAELDSTGGIDAFIKGMVSSKDPSEKPEDIAEQIVAELGNMGQKNIQSRYDYILSQVTKYWK